MENLKARAIVWAIWIPCCNLQPRFMLKMDRSAAEALGCCLSSSSSIFINLLVRSRISLEWYFFIGLEVTLLLFFFFKFHVVVFWFACPVQFLCIYSEFVVIYFVWNLEISVNTTSFSLKIETSPLIFGIRDVSVV